MNNRLNDSAKIGLQMSWTHAAKAIFLTLLAAYMAVGLSSCGGTEKGTEENQVKDDALSALAEDTTLSAYNLDANSVSVLKRQTNTEDKTDFVWCEIAATGDASERMDKDENGKFSCLIECKLTYSLYNDGWRLDTCTCNMVPSSVKPLSFPTKEQVESLAKREFYISNRQFEVHDMIQKSNTEIVYEVDIYSSDGTTSKKELIIRFSSENGWYFSKPGLLNRI